MRVDPRLHRIVAAQPKAELRVDGCALSNETQFTLPRRSPQPGEGERAERKDFRRRTWISKCTVRQAEHRAALQIIKPAAQPRLGITQKGYAGNKSVTLLS